MKKFKNITPEQARINRDNFNSNDFDFSTSHEQFLNAYDFSDQPSHNAKCMSSNAKNHLQLLWKQWVACEEAMGEMIFGLPAQHTLGEQTGIEQLRAFYHYFGGVLDVYEQEVKKEAK